MELYQKYRPIKFSEIVGQDKTSKELLKRSKLKTIPQSIYLHGDSGQGKTTLSRIIAMSLTCKDLQGGEPCGKCNSCKDILNETFSGSVKEYNASNIDTDFMRSLEEEARLKSVFGSKKVYIINEFQELSNNAKARKTILSLLENKNNNSNIIITSMDDSKTDKAIKNRCTQYKIKSIDWKDIASYLYDICIKEGISEDVINHDVLMTVSESSDGSMRQALSWMERIIASELWTNELIVQELGLVDNQTNDNLLQALVEKNLSILLQFGSHDESYIKRLRQGMSFAIKKKAGVELNPWESKQCNIRIDKYSLAYLSGILTGLDKAYQYPYIDSLVVVSVLSNICKDKEIALSQEIEVRRRGR